MAWRCTQHQRTAPHGPVGTAAPCGCSRPTLSPPARAVKAVRRTRARGHRRTQRRQDGHCARLRRAEAAAEDASCAFAIRSVTESQVHSRLSVAHHVHRHALDGVPPLAALGARVQWRTWQWTAEVQYGYPWHCGGGPWALHRKECWWSAPANPSPDTQLAAAPLESLHPESPNQRHKTSRMGFVCPALVDLGGSLHRRPVIPRGCRPPTRPRDRTRKASGSMSKGFCCSWLIARRAAPLFVLPSIRLSSLLSSFAVPRMPLR